MEEAREREGRGTPASPHAGLLLPAICPITPAHQPTLSREIRAGGRTPHSCRADMKAAWILPMAPLLALMSWNVEKNNPGLESAPKEHGHGPQHLPQVSGSSPVR